MSSSEGRRTSVVVYKRPGGKAMICLVDRPRQIRALAEVAPRDGVWTAVPVPEGEDPGRFARIVVPNHVPEEGEGR